MRHCRLSVSHIGKPPFTISNKGTQKVVAHRRDQILQDQDDHEHDRECGEVLEGELEHAIAPARAAALCLLRLVTCLVQTCLVMRLPPKGIRSPASSPWLSVVLIDGILDFLNCGQSCIMFFNREWDNQEQKTPTAHNK